MSKQSKKTKKGRITPEINKAVNEQVDLYKRVLRDAEKSLKSFIRKCIVNDTYDKEDLVTDMQELFWVEFVNQLPFSLQDMPDYKNEI